MYILLPSEIDYCLELNLTLHETLRSKVLETSNCQKFLKYQDSCMLKIQKFLHEICFFDFKYNFKSNEILFMEIIFMILTKKF